VVADPLENFLLSLTARLRAVGCPYPQGTSIVVLTAVVKFATFPFTKRQIESGLAMQNLQPQVKALRERWAGETNASKLQKELSELYKRYSVNPLAGCVPTLLTLPVFWGLYRALSNGSVDGAFSEPFWWLPSLAGPTYDSFVGNTGGSSWLFPLDRVTHSPPIGWPAARAYLGIPLALVVSQYVSTVLLPATTEDDPEKETEAARTTKQVLKLLPLLVGYFSLNVPSGLGLYWLANNVFTTATTYYLKHGGGAEVLVPKLEKPKLKLGTAIRTGEAAAEEPSAVAVTDPAPAEAAVADVAPGAPAVAAQPEAPAPPAPAAKLMRAKRLKDPELRKTEKNPGGWTRLPARKA
jgi:YidC/Oxa1 family membrane protein insertase